MYFSIRHSFGFGYPRTLEKFPYILHSCESFSVNVDKIKF